MRKGGAPPPPTAPPLPHRRSREIGNPGQGRGKGPSPPLVIPPHPTVLPAKAGIQRRSACPFVLSLSKGVNGGAIAPSEGES